MRHVALALMIYSTALKILILGIAAVNKSCYETRIKDRWKKIIDLTEVAAWRTRGN